MDGSKILSISGWTQSPDALKTLFSSADSVDYIDQARSDQVAELLPQRDYDLVIGWSLGGLIARQLMKQGVLRARSLVLISSPFQFVRSERVEAAMPRNTFERFYANYRDDTERTIARFSGLLVKGDTRESQIRRQLTPHARIRDAAAWLRWMDVLETYSAADHDYAALPDTLIIHGVQDAIIPVEQAYLLATHLPNAQLLIMENAGHAPHWHNTEYVRDAICAFHANPGIAA